MELECKKQVTLWKRYCLIESQCGNEINATELPGELAKLRTNDIYGCTINKLDMSKKLKSKNDTNCSKLQTESGDGIFAYMLKFIILFVEIESDLYEARNCQKRSKFR